MQMDITNKLVAIINKELPTGVAMNALAHLSFGLGASIKLEEALLDNYQDLDGNIYPHVSRMPFIVLRATSNEIKKTLFAIREQNIAHTAFINTMTGGTYAQQLANTANTSEAEIVYYGLVLFGAQEAINPLTKKFSLWKNN